MIRLFQTNEIRKAAELDGLWDFALLEGGEAPDYAYRLPVPGCWEQHPALTTYRGRGVYRRKVAVNRRTALRFVFKGVSHTATVRFDDVEIASHYNAYTAFDAVVPLVEPGEHELTVTVDNSFHEHSSLHLPNDYYSYGGIIRPVVMEEIGAAWLDHASWTPFQEDGTWGADIRVTVRSLKPGGLRVNVSGELAGSGLALGEGTVSPDEPLVLRTRHLFPGAEPWSEANPALYMLKTRLFLEGAEGDDAIDDLIERVGFRTVTTRGGKIQVNGEDIVLKGFNRHEDHPMAGAALPISLMVQDMQLMRDMGANCVRTSHYPNDERFLDLCDETGMLVWEENHARGLSIEQMRHPMFIQQCADVNREMVEQHGNHPSIIVWGVLNECASDCEEGRAHYERQIGQIRAMDASRPITFASHHRAAERCFDLADIVSFNLYPGWYTDEEPGELCDRARGWADAAGGLGKPMIMSEFGGDGYYGYRDVSRVRGTEERQADLIDRNLSAYMARPYLSGMLIWQFCDCRVSEGTGWLLSRAGTQNSKGIVDRYRRPKLAYDVVKRHWRND